ncbi:hypothetical protein DFJ67_0767 [Asanoa ferruginea]|uniref:Outer membrane channel protein CpnT-like N-terminal domain-containing protein n=1 Tax=Asanoa ferruginea TaxID=53367 RepID=A0A3D9ZG29_9ACTN|nr:hypothetical protein [Asanoa ferruginea]REF94823.1 hypothetical protein DFJ67_0767 [Asanoa ferruginea]GIF45599.1 hypothetical protein Afe04nite_01380 [Asanoa ferruginea]
MSLELPGELRSLLGVLGYTWPEADEDKLFEMGEAWLRFATTLDSLTSSAQAEAAPVWSGNTGADIAAFQRWWTNEDSPLASMRDGMPAAVLTGTGLIICGTIVLALKVAVIVQLTILAVEIAQAIATATVTVGASLAEIPIFQQVSRIAVGALFDQVISTLLEA